MYRISGQAGYPDSKFNIRLDIRLAGYLEPDKPDILNIQFNYKVYVTIRENQLVKIKENVNNIVDR